ncbi:hypothetical protein SAMN04487948_105371 [Halogranum amylolyticum]|uniref:Uncharacterized protein n=1 Tax=Halogranum amylolyticum TaxID=660520 RepID=A0A1H8SWP0_9EURY|nr:hypothetical protein [Halogranum amylolyticum]SEO83091.1 hypothetical protein SAMN04487948_105371 [Halogranum amylolyticum]
MSHESRQLRQYVGIGAGVAGLLLAAVVGVSQYPSLDAVSTVYLNVGILSSGVTFVSACFLSYEAARRLLGRLLGVAVVGAGVVLASYGLPVVEGLTLVSGATLAVGAAALSVAVATGLSRLDRELGLETTPEERILTAEEYLAAGFDDD